MVLRIRLARPGPAARRRLPLYNIVLSQARTARDSKPMEVLGTYNPTPLTPLASNEKEALAVGGSQKYKDVQLDITRTKYWLGVGAQPSEPVAKLLTIIGLYEPKKKYTKDGSIPTSTSTSTSTSTQSQAL